jgi:hypothetical protein
MISCRIGFSLNIRYIIVIFGNMPGAAGAAAVGRQLNQAGSISDSRQSRSNE